MKKSYLSASRTGRCRLPHASTKYQPVDKTELGRQLKQLLYCSIESGRPQSQSPGSVMMAVVLVYVIYFYIPFVVPRVFFACFLSSFLLLLYAYSPSPILFSSVFILFVPTFHFQFLTIFSCENVPYYWYRHQPDAKITVYY